jgi:hypothetical protein
MDRRGVGRASGQVFKPKISVWLSQDLRSMRAAVRRVERLIRIAWHQCVWQTRLNPGAAWNAA